MRSPVAPREVQIADVVYDPVGLQVAGEFVLLRNVGATDVELTGWRLHDTVAHRRAPYTYRFPRFTLRAGDDVRIHTGRGVNDQDDLYWGRGWAVWNNTGDTAVLEDDEGTEIDRFEYPKPNEADERFPDGFLWGVATAGYQVEGNSTGQDWDLFTASKPIHDRVRANSQRVGLDIDLKPAGRAVDHFDINVLARDLDRAAALGVNTYRLSIDWGRLETTDTGTDPLTDADLDPRARSYYSRALEGIVARGMRPMVTLNHLVLPTWVLVPPEATSVLGETMVDDAFNASLRGWENGATVDRFIRYVEYVVAEFKDRVDLWITVNEPVGSMVGVGYLGGAWPPGFTLDGARAKQAYFNLIRAHVRAYDAIKRIDDVDADGDGEASRVSFAHAMIRARNAPGSVNADSWRQFDYFYNWHMLDAVVSGEIDTKLERNAADREVLSGSDAATWLGVPDEPWRPRLDFAGLNYYRSAAIWWELLIDLRANFSGGAFDNDLHDSDAPHSLVNDLGWELRPEGIAYFISEIHKRYALPTIVTENGIPEVSDRNRSAHLVGHLSQMLAASRAGATVEGYIHWTLLDNFEWHEHYRPQARFGLFTVDRERPGLPRMLTEGGLTYARVIDQNGIAGLRAAVGMMEPGGNAVTPPSRLDALVYAGVAQSVGALVLHLSRLGGRWSGLLEYAARERWLQLREVAWDDTTARLRFTHPAAGEVPARSFELTAESGRLVGEFREAGSTATAFVLSRLTLAAPWRATASATWLGFSRVGWNEPWRSRILTAEAGMWQSLPDVTFDDVSGAFESPPGPVRLSGTIEGEAMSATLTVLAFTTSLELERAPSDLPFG